MKNYILFALLLLPIWAICQEKKDSQPTQNKVKILAEGKLRCIELEGTAYERGLQHGKLLKQEIAEVIQLYKKDIKQNTKMEAEQFKAKFLEDTDFKTAIKKWTPDLLEELRGIAEGSGIELDWIYMHNLGDEYWFYTQELVAHHCSSFGVNKTENTPSMAAQNMDIPGFYHGFQTVMKIIQEDKELMILTIPGHLGLTGMNNRQVSINCNTLMQLGYGREGMPVTFVVRGVLDNSQQKDALKFLKDIRHASGQNYMIGGPEKVHSMECSANTIAEFRPFKNASFTYHTNHPLANKDYNSIFLSMLDNIGVPVQNAENLDFMCKRIPSFRKRFNEQTQGIQVEDIQEVLRARESSSKDVVSNENTYSSVIYILSKTPQFIIAPGKPHEVAYLEIEFN